MVEEEVVVVGLRSGLDSALGEARWPAERRVEGAERRGGRAAYGEAAVVVEDRRTQVNPWFVRYEPKEPNGFLGYPFGPLGCFLG